MVSLKEFFDKPFAGPGTQKAYEMALGRFLVAFNRVDNAVRIMVRQSLKELKQEAFWSEIRSHELLPQLRNLQMLSFGMAGFPDLPIEKIKALNNTRNVLAHGHFNQDLFSEEYTIVGKTKDTVMSITEIDTARSVAEDLVQEIESAMVYFWFEAIPEPDDQH